MQKIALGPAIAVLIVFWATTHLMGQDQNNGSNAFNFLEGKWDLTWNENNTKVFGKNKIKRILDNRIIKEEFTAKDSHKKDYKCMSWIHYDHDTGIWSQTRVNNKGQYMLFQGQFEKDKRMFVRQFTDKGGKTVHQRMVYYNITTDTFDWNWEISTDMGKTWKVEWQIHYSRDVEKKKKKKK